MMNLFCAFFTPPTSVMPSPIASKTLSIKLFAPSSNFRCFCIFSSSSAFLSFLGADFKNPGIKFVIISVLRPNSFKKLIYYYDIKLIPKKI